MIFKTSMFLLVFVSLLYRLLKAILNSITIYMDFISPFAFVNFEFSYFLMVFNFTSSLIIIFLLSYYIVYVSFVNFSLVLCGILFSILSLYLCVDIFFIIYNSIHFSFIIVHNLKTFFVQLQHLAHQHLRNIPLIQNYHIIKGYLTYSPLIIFLLFFV